MARRVIVFDVNETLLDLGVLDETFRDIFGGPEFRAQWFAQVLNLAMTATLTANYRDFSSQARAALALLAAKNGIELEEDRIAGIVDQMKHLRAHEDAEPALKRFKEAGFRLAALTNSSPDTASVQLHNAGLAGYFEAVMSVDETRRFKPAPEPYQMAARRMGVITADMRMVAAHDWDIAGAMSAGCQGAFVMRDRNAFNPLAPQPDIVGPTLTEVAEAIIQADS